MGFFEDRLNVIIDAYVNNVTDRLVSGYRVPSSSGYAAVPYRNSGKTRDSGWEIQVNTNRLVKIKDFGMDLNFNFGNNRNEILEMDEFILKNLNSTYTYKNAEWLRRVQLNNPLGAIYGFRSLGVYQYTYDYVTNRSRTFANTADYRNWLENDFLASGKTAPIVLNENGKPVYGSDGLPRRMMFNYTNDGTGKNYSFNGGDARYEDVNHDGQIDALDIVYLGSSLPKLYGGFGFTFTYGDWRLNRRSDTSARFLPCGRRAAAPAREAMDRRSEIFVRSQAGMLRYFSFFPPDSLMRKNMQMTCKKDRICDRIEKSTRKRYGGAV